MKKKQIIDVDRALSEKKAMQKTFFREHGHSSSVLALLITYFEERKNENAR